MSAIAIAEVAAPGDCLCKGPSASQFDCGSGTTRRHSDGGIYATLVGKVHIDDEYEYDEGGCNDTETRGAKKKRKVVHVLSFKECGAAHATVLRIGDECVGRVTRVTTTQVFVSILYAGGTELRQRGRGVVRKEDVRATEVDKIAMNDCFRPGDIIKAAVISLGDSWQYYLSTSDPQHGVLYGFSGSNALMHPVNEGEMLDVSTKRRFKRKVAVIVAKGDDGDDDDDGGDDMKE